MALVVVYLVVAIAIVVIAWRVADDRGRRPGVWGGLAFLFGIFALLVLILLPSKAEERQAAPIDTSAGVDYLDQLERLERLNRLRQSGALTDEEYEHQKQRLLSAATASEER